ncbi:nickel import ATP-binding protein NikE [Domibacillus aminovorans]|uniref:Nickel import ATP-binding protein NikE n=1 Tax=Domibacillus aminovorans TaxID=29332 RepID=A0A177KXR2_9BACI|nr:dipeptide/oligopeptide/nickel ABC transporter ATP-binding protein [Domibacillus aminovorans]OAH57957.1 nickel import ATP-binding protein NikE [Domibacillus aminovorans]
MSLLEVSEVTKTYSLKTRYGRTSQKNEVVNNVSFSLDRDTCLGLIGESGSGKSTLVKIILGLEKPDQGEVRFRGKSLFKLHSHELKILRRDLQVVFQDCYNSVNPRLTVEEIVGEPLRNYEKMTAEQQRKRVQELLEIVRLHPDEMKKYPHQCSGGQLQRVNIARAIALKPKMILLDEPVSSLDMVVQADIIDLLANLRDMFQLSYLFISHDLHTVRYLADQLMVMDKGRIIETLNDMDQLDQLKHPISRELITPI